MEQTERKKFKYRGKDIEELKAMDTREVTKYLPARSRRSVLRNFQQVENFVARCKKKNTKGKKIRTHLRKMIVVPQMVGMNIQIHSGNKFVPVEIVPEMIGHYLGEFAPTRGRIVHSKSGVGATKGSRAKSKK